MTTGRNDPCPCGSGKKYKKCCLQKEIEPSLNTEPLSSQQRSRFAGQAGGLYDDRPAIAIIKPSSFYSSKDDKILLNWHCYEVAMAFYDQIKKDHPEQLKKYAISNIQLAGFSIYLSKKIKIIILQTLGGRIKEPYISDEIIISFFPYLDYKMIEKLLESSICAWKQLLDACTICPTACLTNRNEYCAMFDMHSSHNFD
ncbi:MAG: SEC-C metal-binding domain-containing protein [archaeon]